MAAIIGGTIAGLGSIGGAILGGGAAEDAARRQASTSANIFARTEALNKPYMYAGNMALNPLMQLYGFNPNLATSATSPGGVGGAATPEQQQAAMDMFYSSPEYTIQKQALDQAMQRSASAGGTMYSPSTALGSAEIAGRTFGDWRNNLAGFAQMGQNAVNQQGTNLQNLGAGLSNAYGNMGQAQSGMYGALGQSIADIGGQISQYGAYNNQMGNLSSLFGGGAGGGSSFGSFSPGYTSAGGFAPGSMPLPASLQLPAINF